MFSKDLPIALTLDVEHNKVLIVIGVTIEASPDILNYST